MQLENHGFLYVVILHILIVTPLPYKENRNWWFSLLAGMQKAQFKYDFRVRLFLAGGAHGLAMKLALFSVCSQALLAAFVTNTTCTILLSLLGDKAVSISTLLESASQYLSLAFLQFLITQYVNIGSGALSYAYISPFPTPSHIP